MSLFPTLTQQMNIPPDNNNGALEFHYVFHQSYFPAVASAALRKAARFPTMAVNPDLMAVTEQRLPHVLHCRKKRRVSLVNSVSEERQV
jgi:hypothetical protein